VDHQGLKLCRRRFLASAAAFTVAATTASARSISGKLPWSPFAGDPPKPVNPLGWYFLTPNEVAAVEAIVDRLIPADHLSVSGKDAGCAVFIDRQLAGSFGSSSRLYMKGPFQAGLPTQGYQGELTPSGAIVWSEGARRPHPRHLSGKTFAQLSAAQQDEVLEGMESGKSGAQLAPGFETAPSSSCCCRTPWKASCRSALWRQPQHGELENDRLSRRPLRYRDYILKYNQPYPFGPVSIMAAKRAGRRRADHGENAPPQGRGDHGAGLDRFHHGPELTDAGLDVLAIERGPWRDTAMDFNIGYMPDELRYAIRKELFLQPAQEAMTMRTMSRRPRCRCAITAPSARRGRRRRGRALEWLLLALSAVRFHLEDHANPEIWRQEICRTDHPGLGHDLGGDRALLRQVRISLRHLRQGRRHQRPGRARRQSLRSSRSREYPNPPLKMPYTSSLFKAAATELGLHPFPSPSANLSRPYVNSLGIAMGECTYCGYCERFGCANYSKSSPQTCVLPVLMKKSNSKSAPNARFSRSTSIPTADRQKRHLRRHFGQRI